MIQTKAIQNLVSDFVDDLQDLFLADLISTLAEKTGGKRPARAIVGAVGSPNLREKGAKRSPEALEALTKKLSLYIAKHPGQRIEQIGAGLGIPTKELNLPAKKLIAAKSVATKGQKRATTYHAR